MVADRKYISTLSISSRAPLFPPIDFDESLSLLIMHWLFADIKDRRLDKTPALSTALLRDSRGRSHFVAYISRLRFRLVSGRYINRDVGQADVYSAFPQRETPWKSLRALNFGAEARDLSGSLFSGSVNSPSIATGRSYPGGGGVLHMRERKVKSSIRDAAKN